MQRKKAMERRSELGIGERRVELLVFRGGKWTDKDKIARRREGKCSGRVGEMEEGNSGIR